jgi:hypothetical protein
VLALPKLARGSRRALTASLALVGACGAVLVVAAWSAGGFAVGLIGGPGYTWLGRYAAGFAGVGALYAMVFVLVNAAIAAGARRPAAPLWTALGALVAAVWLSGPPTLARILALALAAGLLATALMAATVRRLRW